MKNKIKQIFKKEQFNPSLLGIFINPFYLARKGLFQAIKGFSHHIQGQTLDIGCGQKPYQNLFATDTYIGLELDTPDNRAKKQADIFYDGVHMPFESESFDSIICNEVLEHVFNPTTFLAEIHRILKSNGGGGSAIDKSSFCMGRA